MKVNTLIFDIGNVLVQQRFEELAGELSSNQAEYDFLMNQMFSGPIWAELDRGTYEGEAEIQAMINVSPEHEVLIRKLYWNLGNCFQPFEGSTDWIRELKSKGYRVYALSNWGRPFYEQGKEKMDFLEEMDGYLLSYRYHVLKPAPEYYQLLLDIYHIQPEEAVFLDDVEKNVRAAEALGIHGIVFQSRDQAKRELAKLGIV